ncbi:MAG: hypothetical protein WCY30_00520 [Candidatus Neomarinimicrobiota bacterium]|jgi:hypothetical protein
MGKKLGPEDRVDVQLFVGQFRYETRQSGLIDAGTVLALREDEKLLDSVKALKQRVRMMQEDRHTMWSMVSTVLDFLNSPQTRLDTAGNKMQNQQGQLIPRMLKMDEQKTIARIRNAIYNVWDKAKQETITISLKESDAQYLAKGMMLRAEDEYVAQPYTIGMYDYFDAVLKGTQPEFDWSQYSLVKTEAEQNPEVK